MELLDSYEKLNPYIVLGGLSGLGYLATSRVGPALIFGGLGVLTHPSLNKQISTLIGVEIPLFDLSPGTGTPDDSPTPTPTDPEPTYQWQGQPLPEFSPTAAVEQELWDLSPRIVSVNYNVAEPVVVLTLSSGTSAFEDPTRVLRYTRSGAFVNAAWMAFIMTSGIPFCIATPDGARLPSGVADRVIAANYGGSVANLGAGILAYGLGIAPVAITIPMPKYVTSETLDVVVTPWDFVGSANASVRIASSTTTKDDSGGPCWDIGSHTMVYEISSPGTVREFFEAVIDQGLVRVTQLYNDGTGYMKPDIGTARLAYNAIVQRFAAGNLSAYFAQYGYSKWPGTKMEMFTVSSTQHWSNYICEGDIP